jgi:hypothetical protein
VTAVRVWTDRHGIGAAQPRTRATLAGIVAREGGGFYPTLELGGGARFLLVSAGRPS